MLTGERRWLSEADGRLEQMTLDSGDGDDDTPPGSPLRPHSMMLSGARQSSGSLDIPAGVRESDDAHESSHRLPLVGPCQAPAQPVEAPEPPGVGQAAQPPRRLTPEDFEILRLVGQGAFGKVFQVKERSSGCVYAMKVMRKAHVIERQHEDYMRTERDVLTRVEHPYIVTLHHSFQTSSKLYLVLDFINGGHLFFQLYRAGIFDEALARFFAAEIVLALKHLHSLGIVHRDLKPEVCACLALACLSPPDACLPEHSARL